jgi:hypothetical protein
MVAVGGGEEGRRVVVVVGMEVGNFEVHALKLEISSVWKFPKSSMWD